MRWKTHKKKNSHILEYLYWIFIIFNHFKINEYCRKLSNNL